MASYYMNGYTPPAGVNSASAVKEYQRQLGVKVDGIWGPDTDAAYKASLASQSGSNFNWGSGSTAAAGTNQVFDSYYNAIKNSISVPTIKVQTPDRDEVSSMWSQVLRPATDAAIAKRNEAAREDMAELDADAVSRGMGSSSYVTSVKAREMEEAQDDISEMEAQYSAMLAERIYDTLSRYEQMNYSARQYNAEAAAAAEKTALAMASDWYNSYLAQQKATAEKKSSGGSSSSSSKKSSLSAADYTEYVRNLTPAQQKLLFTSGEQYWSSRRDEIYSALGSTLYENLKKQYGGK